MMEYYTFIRPEELSHIKLEDISIKELFLLAIATSIDALAVGISFAFLNYPIALVTAIIGITTFVISVLPANGPLAASG